MIRWFVGYDPRESVAYHVLAQSLIEQSSIPIQITPLALRNLGDSFNRRRDPLQSNDFSFSRFMVPFLCSYQGHAIYSDCDMLVRSDPAALWGLRNHRLTIQCVKHDHQPTDLTKYLGNVQTVYPRKNWSSLMILNCSRLRHLVPAKVERASGLELHRFVGIPDEQIGALPADWNRLVGYDAHDETAKLVHWTAGGPWFEEFADVEFALEWWQTYGRMIHADESARQLNQ